MCNMYTTVSNHHELADWGLATVQQRGQEVVNDLDSDQFPVQHRSRD